MSRTFFHSRISELEAEFARRRGDFSFLKDLLDELGYRSTDRALRLKAQAAEALAKAECSQKTPAPRSAELPRVSTSSKPPSAARIPLASFSKERMEPSEANNTSQDRPLNLPFSNVPEAILDAWATLEVLSPPPFRRPEDLAGGDRQAVAWLDREHLPWEGKGEKARPKTRLYYQIVLGSIDLETATTQLLSRFTDLRAERPVARGEAVLAVVIVDREGRLVETPAASVSSFAWGVPHALQGNLAVLGDWSTAERPLLEALDEVLRCTDDEDKEIPLDRGMITAGWEWLIASLDLPRELVAPPRFAIRSFEYYKSFDPPEPILLNSFFLEDLSAARILFSKGQATSNLRRYLGSASVSRRYDMAQDTDALEAAVAPAMTPPARWPGPGRRSLVLLQQAAVNLAFKELKDVGILAVNGPPGTGKTTLLRDLVAALVSARAEIMASFADPVKAFIHSGEKLRAGQHWLHLYHLDSRLKGFEMLVASSNNRAVENVSAELPGLSAVAADAEGLRYFATLSDVLLKRETWGLIAAVLGNAANRSRFKKTFWWDDDFGLSPYLAEVAGTPQLIEVNDPKTGLRETRPPRIVTQENPPRDHKVALERWEQARVTFLARLQRSRKHLEELAKVREMAVSLPVLAREEAEANTVAEAARVAEVHARETLEIASVKLAATKKAWTNSVEELGRHDEGRPSLLVRLFRTSRARVWRSARLPLIEKCEQNRELHSRASRSLTLAEERFRESAGHRQAAERQRSAAVDRHAAVRREVALARERIGPGFIDETFFARERADQQTTVPWLNTEQQRARDDVFIAAMALHRAFLDAAAKPIRQNLGALMNLFGGRAFPTPEKRAMVSDLWASLFLTVPLVSTTFASVDRMLGALPPESLGWLFVDEAGQALPQAAVGALMRSRRAVIVGDPMQIEPIVSLPDTLTHAICRHFGVDPDRFNAPNASVQTLADAATPYCAEFHTKYGSRSVGIPLFVHRRCAEPMFGVSNAVAYSHLMVNAKAIGISKIGEILGPSTWFDIRGRAVEKWCPEEGDATLVLFRRLAEKGINPDLYVVTPFVVVAENLRKVIRDSGLLERWVDDPRKWTSERVGTVHTVQGREAEAVILVLGAPASHQTGARGWAGGQPNLLNVAVTRAKERLYVLGNRGLWREAGLFRELDARLANPDE